MDPGTHNFTIWAGATFDETVEWRTATNETVDLNDYTGRMEIRDATGTLLATLTNDNGGILPQVDGTARLFIDDNDTRLMVAGTYFYDLLFERIADDVVTALLKGKATVKALVTQVEP